MHGHVPGLPEAPDGLSVPPVLVELAVGETQELTNQVERGVE